MANFPAVPPSSRFARRAFLGLVLVLGLGGAALLAAVGLSTPSLAYHLDPSSLVVEARLGVWPQGRTFDRATLTDVRVLPQGDGWRRVAGTGMPGYCTGTWEVPGVGRAWIATTCSPVAVAFRADGEDVVLSPPDPEGFVRDLAQPGSRREDVLPARGPGALGLVFVGLAVLCAGTAGLVGRVLTREMAYDIDRNELIVPTHFGRLRLPLTGATLRPGTLEGAFRMAGSGVPGVLHLGVYRNAEGVFHAASTSGGPGWFVTSGRTVFVTPEDREAFRAAAVAAGARVRGG